MVFIESPLFSKYLYDYLTDDEYTEFQQFLSVNPETGSVIQGTGGFRKVRWSSVRKGKGKRGGVRIVYYYFTSEYQILLFTIYSKGIKDDIDMSTKKAMKAFVRKLNDN